MSELTPQLRERIENTIRFLSVDAVARANSGHVGAPMGLARAAFELWDARPLVGRMKSRNRLIVVVLPAPLAPSRQKISPSSTFRFTWSRASCPSSYRLVRSSARSIAVLHRA